MTKTKSTKTTLSSKLSDLEEIFIYVEVKGAAHGFMCEERKSLHKDASLIGWNLLMRVLN